MNRERRWPIAAYLGVLLVLFGAAAGFGVIYGQRTANRDAIHDAEADAGFAVDQGSKSVNSALSQLAGQAGQLAATPGLAAAFRGGCTLSFAGVGPFGTGHLDVLRPDGTVACSSRAVDPSRGDSGNSGYSGQAWLAPAEAQARLFGPLVDAVTGRSVVGEVAAIPGGGSVVGFVDMAGLGPGLASLYGGARHVEFLVTTAGGDRSLSRSLDAGRWTDANLSATPFAGAGTGRQEHRDVDGHWRIYAQAPVSATGWRVYAGVDRSTALVDADQLFRRELELILGSGAVMAISAIVVWRRIAVPITRLAKTIRSRAEHATAEPIVLSGPAELAALAGEFNRLLSSLRTELTQRQSAEGSYRILFDDNPQPMWVYDRASLRFVAVNDAAVAHYGYSRDEFLAMTIRDIRPAEDVAQLEASVVVDTVLDHSGPWRHRRKDGTLIEVEINSHSLYFDGRDSRFVMAIDITQRQIYERQLRDLALRDSLTGLASRAVVVDRLEEAVDRRDRGAVGVLVVDLDGFTMVNDAHGRDVGDALLQQVGARLSSMIGPNDTLGRLGADEFAIVCERHAGPLDIIATAEHIDGGFEVPFAIDAHELFVTLSVGVAIATGERNAEEMLRDATATMHRVKRTGGARVEIFDAGIRARRLASLETERELRRAIEGGELRLFYQPEIELSSGACHGVEALARWQHPTRGLLAPAEFIPIAEETGLISGLGRWAFAEACRQTALWRARPGLPPIVSVNLSARQLAQPDLLSQVTEALDQAHTPPEGLCLELTETTLMGDSENALAVLLALRDLGVLLSIDDFGTGYSSLVYLRRYPFQYLKIDRSFVAGLITDAYDTAIVTGVVDLGHSFGLSVVAEGVETPEQLAALQQIGCDLGQGYHWAPALPPHELEAMLTSPGPTSTTVTP